MTWVKICGITNLEDALMAVDAGADALGFVFYEKSPRKVDSETVREIVKKLPEKVEKVGVFVNSTIKQIRDTASNAGLTTVQLLGKQSLEAVWADTRPLQESLGASKFVPVFPGDSLTHDGTFISNHVREKIFAILLDSLSNCAVGGTGTTFDWDAARSMVQSLGLKIPLIVAGGLTASNVARAQHLLQPFGVDVSSGVESSPGKKDPQKVRAFINAVREAEKAE